MTDSIFIIEYPYYMALEKDWDCLFIFNGDYILLFSISHVHLFTWIGAVLQTSAFLTSASFSVSTYILQHHLYQNLSSVSY